MTSAFAAVLTAGLALGSPPGQPVGYLWSHVPDGEGGSRKLCQPYIPREGDLIFFDDQSKLWEKLYKLGGSAPPFHVGIVVKSSCGSLAVLESGPDDTLHVYILECWQRLHTFKGILQVRRCKKDVCPEESARLTAFACDQEGKRYAMWRLLLQGTPFRTRGKYSSLLFGTTYMNRSRWLCAEIVCTGCAIIGTFDGKVIKGTDTYPLDIVDDHMYELAPVYEEACYWLPKAE
jgi:hypothetical protein